MSKVSAFLGRKPSSPDGEQGLPVVSNQKREATEEILEPSHFAEIGEENEALRTLLLDTARRVSDLDLVKEAFSKISEPVAKTMRALEQEKLHNAALQTLLTDVRAAHEKQRSELQLSERRTASLENVNEKLREDLEVAQQQFQQIEAARLGLLDELNARRDQISNLDRNLAHETGERERLADDYRTVSMQLSDAERRIVVLGSDAATAREKCVMAEDELRAVQKSLDDTIAESARLARRLTEVENELTSARAQIVKLSTAVTEAEAERDRLTNALDEATGRHQTETYSLTVRLGSLQSRALSAEKLLAEVRQSLVARTEAARSFDRKNVETTIALNTAEKKLRQLEASVEALEHQLRDNEQTRTAMSERSNTLARSLRERESALSRAEEHNQALTGRIAKLEADMQVSQAVYDKRIEDLNAALHRERLERSVVEGALESARRDYVRLQGETGGDTAGKRLAAVPSRGREADVLEDENVKTIPGPSVQP